MREAREISFVTLDSDLQNDPADIPKLLRSWIIMTWPRDGDRRGGSLAEEDFFTDRQYSSEPIERGKYSGQCLYPEGVKKECIKDIWVFNGMHRFLSTLAKMEGYRIIEVPWHTIPGSLGNRNTYSKSDGAIFYRPPGGEVDEASPHRL
jgi:hypothetical protein